MASERGFVNRVHELTSIDQLLETINRPEALSGRSYLPQSVVNIYGAPGIGKSSLMREFRSRWHARSVKTLFIDLHETGFRDDAKHQKALFCQTTLDQLTLDGQQLGHLHQRLEWAQAQDEEALDPLVAELVALIQVQAGRQAFVLLIDACEQATDSFFAWLERRVLLPLVHDPAEQPPRVLCLLASQLLLRWRQHNVRRRVKVLALDPLSPADTIKQVGAAEPELGQRLYDLTFGHPLATEVAMEQIPPRLAPPERTAWVIKHEPDLSKIIVRRLQQHAVRSMPLPQPGMAEQPENWEIWNILEAISILREFDPNSMRVILKAYNSKYSNSSQSMLLINIRELLETRLAVWNSDVRAYQVAASIRRIIAHALAIHNASLYVHLRDQARQYYQQQIRTVMSNRHVYILEYFFQLLSHPHPPPEALDHLDTTLGDLLERYYSQRDDALQQLMQALVNDQELQELLVQRGQPAHLLISVVDEFQNLN